MSSRHHQELQFIAVGVQQRNCEFTGAVQRPRINNSRGAVALIAANMRVSMQQIIHALFQRRRDAIRIMSMRHCKSATATLKARQWMLHKHAYSKRIAAKNTPIWIAIAKHQMRLSARELVNHLLGFNVATVGKFACAVGQQQLHGFVRSFVSSVAV